MSAAECTEQEQEERIRLEDKLARHWRWIEKLHRYNEIKDAAQLIIGKLAVIHGVCTRDLYNKYDLELQD
jgi:hypothetical protein